jgi:hypothetical protein
VSPQTTPVSHLAVILSVAGADALGVFSNRITLAFPTFCASELMVQGGSSLWAPAAINPVTHVPVWEVSPQDTPAQIKSLAIADFAALMPPGPEGKPGKDGEDSTVPGPPGPGIATGGNIGDLLRKKSLTNFDTEWFKSPYVVDLTDADDAAIYVRRNTGSARSWERIDFVVHYAAAGTVGLLPVWSGASTINSSRLPNPPQDAAAQLYAYRASVGTGAGAWEAFVPGGSGLSGGIADRLAYWTSPTTLGNIGTGVTGNVLRFGSPPTWGTLAFGELSDRPDTLVGYGITDAFTKTETIAAIQTAFPKPTDPDHAGGAFVANDLAVFKVNIGWVHFPAQTPTAWGSITGILSNQTDLWTALSAKLEGGPGTNARIATWTGSSTLGNSNLPNPPIDASARLYAYRAPTSAGPGAWEVFTPGGGSAVILAAARFQIKATDADGNPIVGSSGNGTNRFTPTTGSGTLFFSRDSVPRSPAVYKYVFTNSASVAWIASILPSYEFYSSGAYSPPTNALVPNIRRDQSTGTELWFSIGSPSDGMWDFLPKWVEIVVFAVLP